MWIVGCGLTFWCGLAASAKPLSHRASFISLLQASEHAASALWVAGLSVPVAAVYRGAPCPRHPTWEKLRSSSRANGVMGAPCMASLMESLSRPSSPQPCTVSAIAEVCHLLCSSTCHDTGTPSSSLPSGLKPQLLLLMSSVRLPLCHRPTAPQHRLTECKQISLFIAWILLLKIEALVCKIEYL